ncbi:hypothetical protein BGX38DRAFT_1190653, partial [Terfezia claveryi]
MAARLDFKALSLIIVSKSLTIGVKPSLPKLQKPPKPMPPNSLKPWLRFSFPLRFWLILTLLSIPFQNCGAAKAVPAMLMREATSVLENCMVAS